MYIARYTRLMLATAVAWLMSASLAVFAAPEAKVASDDVALDVVAKVRSIVERAPTFQAMAARGKVVFVGIEGIREKSAEDRGLQENFNIFRTTHYRYVDNVTVYSLVDMRKNAIIESAEARNAPTALAAEEVEDIRKLVLANPEVRRAFGARLDRAKIEAMPIRSSDPKDVVSRHRVASVFFKVDNLYLTGFIVMVDLTDRAVRVVQSAPRKHEE